jgi:hypothetical protein
VNPQKDSRVYKSTVARDEDASRVQHRRYGHVNNDCVQKSVYCTQWLGDKPLEGDHEADCDSALCLRLVELV